jgi:hypothetical protein
MSEVVECCVASIRSWINSQLKKKDHFVYGLNNKKFRKRFLFYFILNKSMPFYALPINVRMNIHTYNYFHRLSHRNSTGKKLHASTQCQTVGLSYSRVLFQLKCDLSVPIKFLGHTRVPSSIKARKKTLAFLPEKGLC